MSVELSEVKTQLGITGSSEDALLTQLLLQATAIAESYARRSFSQSTITEYHDGNGTSKLVLRIVPVASITTIHVDDARTFGSDSLLDSSTDYTFDAESGIVYRLKSVWPKRLVHGPGQVAGGYSAYGSRALVPHEQNGQQNIKIVYVGGPSDTPEDVKFAIISIVAAIRKQKDLGGPLVSERLDYYGYQLAGGDEISEHLVSAKSVLNRYRRPVF